MDLMLVVFHFPRFLHFNFSSNEIYIVMLKQALSLHSIDSMDPTNNRGAVRVSYIVGNLHYNVDLGSSGPGVMCRSLLYTYPYSAYIAKTGEAFLNMAPFFSIPYCVVLRDKSVRNELHV